MILSASSIGVWLKCPRRWMYQYVWRLKSPQGMPQAIGQAVHSAVEAHYASEDAAEALRRSFEAEVAQVPISEVVDDPDARADAEAAFAAYQREVIPWWHPTMVERKFAFDWDGVRITGIIDGADETTDTVADTKVTAGKTINGRKPRFDPARYDFQLALYDLGYESITGRPAKEVRLDVVSRRGTYRKFVRNPSVKDALDIVSIVRDAASTGEYDATGAFSGACRWCPYSEICPSSANKQ